MKMALAEACDRKKRVANVRIETMTAYRCEPCDEADTLRSCQTFNPNWPIQLAFVILVFLGIIFIRHVKYIKLFQVS